MNNFISSFTSLLPILISAGAFTVSILVYLRQRTVDNENHFFNFKLDQYYKIIDSASSTLEIIYSALHEYMYELEEIDTDEDALDDIYKDVDKKMIDFRITLHKGCAFVPKNIVENLDEFYNEVFALQEVIEDENPKVNDIKQAILKVDDVSDQLDEIINLMRSDMGIENIDHRLKKRAR